MTATPEKSSKRTKRERILDEAFTSFWGEIGSVVVFKNNRGLGIDWTVDDVVREYDKVKWSNGGKVPNFIKLRRLVTLAGGKQRFDYCFTSVGQIKPKGM